MARNLDADMDPFGRTVPQTFDRYSYSFNITSALDVSNDDSDSSTPAMSTPSSSSSEPKSDGGGTGGLLSRPTTQENKEEEKQDSEYDPLGFVGNMAGYLQAAYDRAAEVFKTPPEDRSAVVNSVTDSYADMLEKAAYENAMLAKSQREAGFSTVPEKFRLKAAPEVSTTDLPPAPSNRPVFDTRDPMSGLREDDMDMNSAMESFGAGGVKMVGEEESPTVDTSVPAPAAPGASGAGLMSPRFDSKGEGPLGMAKQEAVDIVADSVGITGDMWEVYSKEVAKIESGGKKDPYTIFGGSNNHYDGKYQLGAMAKADAGQLLGFKIGHTKEDRDRFRNNSSLQEKAFAAYTAKNHSYLMNKSNEYRGLDKAQQLAVLGYAHNQGHSEARKWLEGGEEGVDGFGTKGSKYTNAISKGLGIPQITPGAIKTESSANRSEATDQIKAAQSYLGVTADGIIGKNTRGAIKDFQRKAGIPVSGKLDEATNQAMQNPDALDPRIIAELPSDIATKVSDSDAKTSKDVNVKIFDATSFSGSIPTPPKGADPIRWITENVYGLNENDPIFREAMRAITNVDPKKTPWCAAFAAYVLKGLGVSLPDRARQNPNLAFNYVKLGEDVYNHNPTTGETYAGSLDAVKAGDVIVFNNGGRATDGSFKYGKGHISFVVGVEKDGSIIALGGNQGGGTKVTTTRYTPAIIKKNYKGGFTVRRINDGSLENTDPSVIAAITKDISVGGAER